MSRLHRAKSVLLQAAQRLGRLPRGRLGLKVSIRSMEFFLADTCNLRCAHCAASSPYLGEANLPNFERFIETLSFLSPVLRCGQLKVLGGEPLLNREVCGFLRAARESGIFRKIRVATNGLLLRKMSDEFWRLTDIVEISRYPFTRDTLSGAGLESLMTMAVRFGTRLEVNEITHFREAISNTRLEDSRAADIFAHCAEDHDWGCHLLYRNRLYRCSRVHTLDRYLHRIGVQHENFPEEDGIAIDGRDSLREELRDYLGSAQPLKACSFCLGTSGPLVEHRQLTVSEIRSNLSNSRPDFASDKPSPPPSECVTGTRSGG